MASKCQRWKRNRLKVTRGEERGDSGGKKGKGLTENTYAWPADMDNGVGIDWGSGGRVRWMEEGKGKKLGQL